METLHFSRPAGVVCMLAFVILAAAVPRTLNAQEAASSRPLGEIGLSDDSLQLRYIQPRMQPNSNIESGELGFGLFLNEARDFVASANYYVEASELRYNRLSIKAGPVAYAALLSTINTDVFALALGAEARYLLLRNPRLTIVGQVAYAPDILAFGSADKMWDVDARAEIPLTDRVVGFGGYRFFRIDLIEGNAELVESLHVGLRYRF
jgi:hypothetical protein